MSLKLPRRPLELRAREHFHRVGPLGREPLHLDAVEPEQRGDAAVGRGQEVACRQRAGERVDEAVSYRQPVGADLLPHLEPHRLDPPRRQLVSDRQRRPQI